MEEKSLVWQELADKLGLSKELMQQMGIGKLTLEQLKMLNAVIDLHNNDAQSLHNFIHEAGLEEILHNLPNIKQEEINDKNNLTDLLAQIKELTEKKN